MDVPNENALLQAARSGDEHALEQLIEQHQDRIYRFGMKMCRHPQDAEDVLQDTLLTMARSIQDFRGASSLSTWLYTVARSVCIKKRRKSKFAPTQEVSLEQDAAGEAHAHAHPGRSPFEAALGNEVQQVLQDAIHGLDPDQREVLVLRDVEGLRASEVSEVLGISVAAVKSRLHRARASVRAAVAPTLGDRSADTPTTPAASIGTAATAPGAGTCPDVLTLYSQHLEGEISADLCEQMERHLATCPRCRSTCDSLKETLALCHQVPTTPVPAPVQASVREALRAFLRAKD